MFIRIREGNIIRSWGLKPHRVVLNKRDTAPLKGREYSTHIEVLEEGIRGEVLEGVSSLIAGNYDLTWEEAERDFDSRRDLIGDRVK